MGRPGGPLVVVKALKEVEGMATEEVWVEWEAWGWKTGGVCTKKTNELPVEIYGVVYLFNPANKDRLGLSKVTEET
ncbi:MAG: hypothetical protein U0930_05805 [Pirellulales bacterium]